MISKVKEKKTGELRKELDDVFSKYIRARDTQPDGFVHCFICGGKVRPKEAVNAHFILRHNTALRWDEDNCHATCSACNERDVQNPVPYRLKMNEKYGWRMLNELSLRGHGMQKFMAFELIDKIEYFKGKIEQLKK